jgi:hypothetical protein
MVGTTGNVTFQCDRLNEGIWFQVVVNVFLGIWNKLCFLSWKHHEVYTWGYSGRGSKLKTDIDPVTTDVKIMERYLH